MAGMPVGRSRGFRLAACPAANPCSSSASSVTRGAGVRRTGEMVRAAGASVCAAAAVPLLPVGAAGRLNDSRETAGATDAPDPAGRVPAGTGIGAAGRLLAFAAAGRVLALGAGRGVLGAGGRGVAVVGGAPAGRRTPITDPPPVLDAEGADPGEAAPPGRRTPMTGREELGAVISD